MPASDLHDAPVLASRNSAIDVLRGLSILLVIIHHLALPFRLPLSQGPLPELFGSRLINALGFNGYSAVYTFFVISGFLIAGRAISRHGSLAAIDIRSFYVYRASRILPLLLALLALLSLLHLLGVPGYVIDKPGQSLGGALMSALGLYLNWYEGRTTWLPANWDVLWSLSIEELFYLVFPLLCVWLPRPLLVIGLVVLVVSLPWTRGLLDGQEIWQEKAYLPAMSAIAAGVLAAMLWRSLQPSRAFARCLCALGALGLYLSMAWGGELWRALRHSSLLFLIGSVVVLLLGCAWGRLGAPRGLGWLAALGRLSYELYLTHMFVVLALVAAYKYAFEQDYYWAFAVYPVSLAACAALAWGVQRHFCQPCESSLRARYARLAKPIPVSQNGASH
ncbi:MAG: acyltransferase [Xanthomonadales bacterium]|nr:acyltransferase [Xanthomonadales bacterium]